MNEHVSYEYQMMTAINELWGGTRPVPSDVWNNMCNIVAYNTAYNIIEYMWGELDITYDVDVGIILNKVHCQIRTISKSRTSKQEDKLQPEDFKKLVEHIMNHKDELNIQG